MKNKPVTIFSHTVPIIDLKRKQAYILLGINVFLSKATISTFFCTATSSTAASTVITSTGSNAFGFFIVCKAGIADAFVQYSGILELNTLEYTLTEFLAWSEYDTWILNHCSGIEIGNIFYTVTFE